MVDGKTFVSILSVAAVADALGRSPQFINGLIRRGKLRAYLHKNPGRPARRVIPVWALMAYQDDFVEEMVSEVLGYTRRLQSARCENPEALQTAHEGMHT